MIVTFRNRIAAIVFVLSLLGSPGLQAAEAIQRLVELRDGTRLWVALPDTTLTVRQGGLSGAGDETKVALSALDELRLVEFPALEQLGRVQSAIANLAASDFFRRETSHGLLIEIGANFRDLLAETFEKTADPEVRWRLAAILRKLPADGNSESGFDKAVLAGGKEILGDVGAWSASVMYRGAKLTLDRRIVRRITSKIDGAQPPSPWAGPRGIARIEEDEDSRFPMHVTRVDFEQDPAGKALTVGEDIGRRFIPLGFTVSTSIEGAIVSVTSYNVGGRSGGRSAATHEPLYQGTLTIRFCLPGNDRIPAAVHHVGFWVSHVSPNGTKMEAYDAADRLLRSVSTVRQTRDFLAAKSETPIAYIKVVPNPEIDPDYAIDDLVFDRPLPLSRMADPHRWTVLLEQGDRLFGDGVEFAGDAMTLRHVSFGPETLTVKQSELAEILTPLNSWRADKQPGGFWVMLADGSVARGTAEDGPRLRRDRDIPLRDLAVAAVWGEQVVPAEPPADQWPADGEMVVMTGGNIERVRGWTLGDVQIEGQTPSRRYSYARLPLIWFRKPAPRTEHAGLVRLANGEQFALRQGAFRIVKLSAEDVTIARPDAESTDAGFKVAWPEISSLRFSRAE